jgi:hypothetical protein
MFDVGVPVESIGISGCCVTEVGQVRRTALGGRGAQGAVEPLTCPFPTRQLSQQT